MEWLNVVLVAGPQVLALVAAALEAVSLARGHGSVAKAAGKQALGRKR